jgi:hypothetical protein
MLDQKKIANAIKKQQKKLGLAYGKHNSNCVHN